MAAGLPIDKWIVVLITLAGQAAAPVQMPTSQGCVASPVQEVRFVSPGSSTGLTQSVAEDLLSDLIRTRSA